MNYVKIIYGKQQWSEPYLTEENNLLDGQLQFTKKIGFSLVDEVINFIVNSFDIF